MNTNHKTVLVIEDEKPLARALELKLRSIGYEVIVTHNGRDGVVAAGKTAIDIVLLDLVLPVMDGFQVLARLKQLQKPPVVFVLSNLSQAEDEQRVLAMGAKKYFVKSDTPLAEIIKEVGEAV